MLKNKVLCRWEPSLKKILFSFNGSLRAIEMSDIIESGLENFFLVNKDKRFDNALSAPVTVQIQTTNKCNFKCEHCYAWSGEKLHKKEISSSEILSLLDRLQKFGVLNIQWVGGEVFVKKGFWKLVEYAQDLGFEQSLLTNGSFFGITSKIEIIERAWSFFDIIQVSVDDYKSYFNSFVHKKAWDMVMNGIKKLSLYKPKDKLLTVATILTKDNVPRLMFLAECLNSHIDVWRLGKEIITGRSKSTQENSIEALFSSFDCLPQLRNRYISMEITHPFDKDPYEESELLLPYDWRSDNGARTFMYIDSTGFAYPFPLLVNMKEFCGGSIFSESLDSIWSSKEFHLYRSVTRNDTGCGGCVEPCQIWPRYHFIQGNSLELTTKPFLHPGCPRCT
ncbi:radical SAM protein [Patescibacteria group bacterium]|nr:radical SAM protein [Patescibacteria group bacterium]